MSSEGEQKLLDAAERLFADKGFDAVSIKQVADAAGISKATIFHYFDNKEALYLAVVRRSCDGILQVLSALTSSADKDPLTKLAIYRQRDLEETMSHSNVVRLVLRELTYGHEDKSQRLSQEVFGEHFLRLRALIEEGQRGGMLRDDIDAGTQAITIAGLNVFLSLTWQAMKHLPESGFSDPFATGEQMFDCLLNGLRRQP